MKIEILYRSLKKCYTSSPLLFILNTILTAILGIGTAINVYVMQNLVNNIQLTIDNNTALSSSIILFVIISFTLILLKQMQSYVLQIFTLKLENNLELDFVNKCSQLDLSDFEDEDIYDLISKAQNLGQEKLINVYFQVMELFRGLVSIISIISLMFSYDNLYWAIILIVPILSFFVNNKLGKYSYEIEKNNTLLLRKSDYIKYLITNDIAIKEIISFNYFGTLLEKFKAIKEEVLQYLKKISFVYILTNGILLIIELLIKSILIVTFIISSIEQSGLIGDIMGFIYSIDNVQNNFTIVFNSLSQLYKEQFYVENFFKFIDIEKEKTEGKLIVDDIKSIELCNLSFSYYSKLALNNIDLHLVPGEPVVLIGENGSGKSTLIKILNGLYENYSGDIYVNGKKFRDINKDSYRQRTSVIYQDFNHYEFTLRENISISNMENITNDDLIYKILDIVELKNQIQDYKDGLDTQMGKWFGGEELSKGQWQRVAISRLLIADADFIIMDEPTSALDPAMESKILDKIMEFAKDKILVIVSHRIKPLLKYKVNFIIMKNGKILKKLDKEGLENYMNEQKKYNFLN